MITIVAVTALAILALITQAGILALERTYPAQGKMIAVAGATLNVIDMGPGDAVGPPVVMIHGASANLEVMRQPLGEKFANTYKATLTNRPGHGWSTRLRARDSSPAVQAIMIDQA